MRTYSWWLGQKRRVQKKYTLFLGWYWSRKEAKAWYKKLREIKREKRRGEENG